MILFIVLSFVAADDLKNFWAGFNETEEPYKHPWKDIPDLIDNKTVSFAFNLTRAMLLGIERGMYNNNSRDINPNCFGPRYVTKANMFKAMMDDKDFWKHLMPMAAIIYQFWYMWAE